MGAEPKRLHIVFFPFLAHGHMIPTLDVARLFAARNVEATIITTRVNAPRFTSAVDTGNRIGNNQTVKLELLRFPTHEAGVPEGCENAEIAMRIPGMMPRFFKGTQLLREQLEQYLSRVKPNCLVADMFYPWATESANKYDIPRLVFHGTSYFSLCAQEIVRVHEPYKMVLCNNEKFTIPLIPHDIKLLRSQMCPDLISDEDNDFRKRMDLVKKSEVESYGVIVNSFYELEPDYAEVYTKELGRKAWHVGPVSLCNRSVLEKGRRGNQASIDEHECLTWLDSKKLASVVYISFGSMSSSITPQLHEIATALENSGCNFIWVVRSGESENHDESFPPGFEQRTKEKGLIIRGWAPQVLILDHEAVGAFMTHCGWNSTLEGITAGVPMITWPHAAEQFYNEKLVTEILKSGVSVGAKIWSRMPSVEDLIGREAIEIAIREVMDGEKAETMRLKAKWLKEMARKAVEEGGSSYTQLSALIEDLKNYHTQK
uniref:Glycosyltransferase n=1 Tax=Dianthus caryophyllus TaxID=3570 RepID=A7M6J5_DIACA|nr:tetrahydroxychalcone glucosyltransferase [Dianthus caryophyllus]